MANKYRTRFTFNKVLKKTSFVCLTIPSWFVKAHGDKFRNVTQLGLHGSNPDWKVKVNVSIIGPGDYVHVSFSTGFHDFCTMYDFKEGERLKFKLIRYNCFTVRRADDGASSSTASV